MMQLSDDGAKLIKQWEGFRHKAYRDTGGVWTIGYGHTRGVKEGDEITQAQAEEYFQRDIAWAVEAVNRLVLVPLAQHQFDALVSFTYNVGETNLRRSTLLKRLNKGRYEDVPDQLRLWVHDSKGSRINGLIHRRSAETGLWVRGSHVSSRTVAAAPIPIRKPLMAMDTVGTALASTGAFLATIGDIKGPLAWVVAGMIALMGLSAIVLIVRRQLSNG